MPNITLEETIIQLLTNQGFKVDFVTPSPSYNREMFREGVMIHASKSGNLLKIVAGEFSKAEPQLFKSVRLGHGGQLGRINYTDGTPSKLPIGTDSFYLIEAPIANRPAVASTYAQHTRTALGRVSVNYLADQLNGGTKEIPAEDLAFSESLARDILAYVSASKSPQLGMAKSMRENGWTKASSSRVSSMYVRKGENIIIPVGSYSAKINGKWIKFTGIFTKTHAPIGFKKYLTRKG